MRATPQQTDSAHAVAAPLGVRTGSAASKEKVRQARIALGADGDRRHVSSARRVHAIEPPADVAADGRRKVVLTSRELEILLLLAEGHTNEEIAAAYGVSAQTVKSHMHGLFLKLKAQNRAHAVAIGFRRGLVA